VVEEQAYRETYRSINQRRCIFEKAINSRRCACAQSARFCLADREGVACNTDSGNRRCTELLENMRRNARFSLQLTQAQAPLPHNKEIRVQVGGLLGLQQVMHPAQADSDTVADVDGLVAEGLQAYGNPESLPWERIVQAIVHYEGRRKRGRRGR
jgi:hypothetical protein